ncbi:MAG: dihydroorotate dehydrogenase [Ignavibacteriae bacterium]|nr:MAG: dihydroorotate dehydrogenase [Ignavibacteriota bacterium]
MFIENTKVISNKKIAENTFLLEVDKENFDCNFLPGQFFNLQVSESSFPLLRRPFSISDVNETSFSFMYKVVGEGTKIISEKKSGEIINLLGPLGNSFEINNEYEHYFLLGGGIGIAPFPFLIKTFSENQNYSVLFGVRTKSESHTYGINNVSFSSDDGSIGFKGNTIQLLDKKLEEFKNKKVKVLACGPNPMFRALQKFVKEKEIDCDVSMESTMACGFGICQGCPIDYKGEESYKLICKDGPVFNIKDIII